MISSKPLAFSSSTCFELVDDSESRSKRKVSGSRVIFLQLDQQKPSGKFRVVSRREAFRAVASQRAHSKAKSNASIHEEVYELAALGDSLGGYTIEGASREELANSLRKALKCISG